MPNTDPLGDMGFDTIGMLVEIIGARFVYAQLYLQRENHRTRDGHDTRREELYREWERKNPALFALACSIDDHALEIYQLGRYRNPIDTPGTNNQWEYDGPDLLAGLNIDPHRLLHDYLAARWFLTRHLDEDTGRDTKIWWNKCFPAMGQLITRLGARIQELPSKPDDMEKLKLKLAELKEAVDKSKNGAEKGDPKIHTDTQQP